MFPVISLFCVCSVLPHARSPSESHCSMYTYDARRSMSAACDEGKGARTGRAPIILVVEDDEDCLETIADTLRDANYFVVEAVDAEQALRHLLAENVTQPKAIVLDIQLPGLSGRELLKVLRSHDRLCRIPVVLTSAGRPCGADTEVDTGWLAKPFDAEHLLSAVDEQLSALVSRVAHGETRDR